MKNKIVFLLAIIPFMHSCMQLSSLSVSKRHYRNGFYIDYGSKNIQTASEKANEPKEVASVKQEKNIEYTVADLPVAAEKKEMHSIHAKQKLVAQEINFKPKQIFEIKNPIQTIKKVSTILKKTERDELSMFWTVIMLIVVIWLIAYLTGGWGLGGLINILLLVALILLVLWLLRIL